MEIIDNSDNVGVSTVREVEVSVHQRPVAVTFAILVTEQAPSMNTMIPAPQCATLCVCAFAASGPHCKCAPPCPKYKCSRSDAQHIFVARDPSTNHNARTGFPVNGQRASVIPGGAGGGSALCRAPLLSQSTPDPSAYIAPPWPMFTPSYLPWPKMEQSSTQAEREQLAMQHQELEARELEVERRTRALKLNAVRDAEIKSAAPSVRSSGTYFSGTGTHQTKAC